MPDLLSHRRGGRTARTVARAAVLVALVAGTVTYAHRYGAFTLVGDLRSAPAGAQAAEGALSASGAPSASGAREAAGAGTGAGGPSASGTAAASGPESVAVTLRPQGSGRPVTTTATTVGSVTPLGELSVPLEAAVVAGMVLVVTRVELRRVTLTQSLSPPTVHRPAATRTAGQAVVAQGVPGVVRRTYEMVVVDGTVARRIPVAAVVVRPPVSRVIEVPAATAAVGGSVGALNWAALARCESGGNPRAVNPAGYYGLYQFSPSTWRSVGGSGLPSDASADEQLYRAELLYQRGGAGQWGCGRHLFD